MFEPCYDLYLIYPGFLHRFIVWSTIFYPETLSVVWTVPCGWTILLPGSVRPHYFHRYLFCYTSVFYAFVSFIMHRIASTAVLIAA